MELGQTLVTLTNTVNFLIYELIVSGEALHKWACIYKGKINTTQIFTDETKQQVISAQEQKCGNELQNQAYKYSLFLLFD
jgi:hypothetical protein